MAFPLKRQRQCFMTNKRCWNMMIYILQEKSGFVFSDVAAPVIFFWLCIVYEMSQLFGSYHQEKLLRQKKQVMKGVSCDEQR